MNGFFKLNKINFCSTRRIGSILLSYSNSALVNNSFEITTTVIKLNY